MSVIPLTDRKGAALVPSDELTEPLPGSVVLTEGLYGTAWQRAFSDGLWHSAMTQRTRTWDSLLAHCTGLVLIYDAEERES